MADSTLQFKVQADTDQAASGFKKLAQSLGLVKKEAATMGKDKITPDVDASKIKQAGKDAQQTKEDINSLDDNEVKIRANDAAIQKAQDEIERLRADMRQRLEADVNADTSDAEKRIRQLKGTIKTLKADQTKIKPIVDTSQATSKIADLKAKLGDMSAKAGDKIGDLAGNFGPLGDAIGGIATKAGPAGVAAGAIAVGVLGIGTAAYKTLAPMVKLADEMENNKIAFTQFLGSADKSTKFLDDLQQFAAATPFEFPDLVQASKKLLAFGITASDVVPLMQSLGDAAALTGSDVNDLATIWGQMSAKGKLTTEDLTQLVERGIPVWSMLADSMGKTVPEIQKLASEGKLGKKELKGLQDQMNKKFGGGMEKQAATLSGQLSTLSDNMTAMKTKVGEALLPIVKEFMPLVIDSVAAFGDWVTENGPMIAKVFTQIGLAVADLAGVTNDMVSSQIFAFQMFKSVVESALGSILTSLGGFISKAGAVVGLVPGMETLGKNMISVGQGAQLMGKEMAAASEKDKAAAAATAQGWQKRKDAIDKAKIAIQEAGTAAERGAVLNAETAEFDKKIQASKDRIKELRDLKAVAKTDADKSALDKKIKEAKGELKQLENGKTSIKIDAKIADAKEKLADIKAKLAALGKEKSTPEVRAKITDLEAKKKKASGSLKDLNKQKATIDIKASDKTGGKLKKAKSDAKSLDKQGATVDIKAKDGASSKIKKAKGAAKDFDKKSVNVDIKAKNTDALSKTKTASAAVKKYDKLSATAELKVNNNNAMSGIGEVKRALNALPNSKTINIRYSRTTTGSIPKDAPKSVAHMPYSQGIQAAPNVTLIVRDEALADFIDVRINGNAAKSRTVINRGGMIL